MKIAVIGAAGRTGRQVVARALEAGHEVVAIARDPGRLGIRHERLRTHAADATDAAGVAAGFAGCQAVVSALGPVKGGPADGMTRAAAAVLAAMTKAGVRRLVWLTGAGVVHEGDSRSPSRSFIRFIMRLVAPVVLADSEAAFGAVTASGLDWTVVRVPMLSDGAAAGGLSAGTTPPKPRPVPRADVAAFLVGQIADPTWVRRSPLVTL